MMTAAANMRSWFSATVRLPHTIVYEPGDWENFSTNRRGREIIDGIYKAWDE